jgi:hypothetical protein
MAQHRQELVFAPIRADELLDSRASEPPWPITPRDGCGPYEAAGRCVSDVNIPAVYGLSSLEPIEGGEWP